MTEQIHPLLTLQGAKAEVMRRAWQEIDEITSHGNVLTPDDFGKIVKHHWGQVKIEIQALKQKQEMTKQIDRLVGAGAHEFELMQ